MFARLAYKLGQIVVEGGSWVGVTVGFGLFVVMAELDDDIVAWLHALEHRIPTSFVDERQ